MKRRFLVGLIVALCLLCACGRERLPSPEYPLSEESIEAAAQAAGLDWAVGEAVAYPVEIREQTGWTVNDGDGRMIAMVSSRAVDEDQRILIVQFMGYKSEAYPLEASMPKADWEKAVRFAALLFGEFTGEDRLYQDLIGNYETKGTFAPVEPPEPGLPYPLNEARYTETIRWDGQADGVGYLAWIGRRMEEDYLEMLLFSNAEGYPAHGYPTGWPANK